MLSSRRMTGKPRNERPGRNSTASSRRRYRPMIGIIVFGIVRFHDEARRSERGSARRSGSGGVERHWASWLKLCSNSQPWFFLRG